MTRFLFTVASASVPESKRDNLTAAFDGNVTYLLRVLG